MGRQLKSIFLNVFTENVRQWEIYNCCLSPLLYTINSSHNAWCATIIWDGTGQYQHVGTQIKSIILNAITENVRTMGNVEIHNCCLSPLLCTLNSSHIVIWSRLKAAVTGGDYGMPPLKLFRVQHPNTKISFIHPPFVLIMHIDGMMP